MALDYADIAKQLITVIGKDNIIAAEHCATRLRLVVKNRELINDAQIDAIAGVKGKFFAAQQYQIIFGTGTVNLVYQELAKLIQPQENSKAAAYSQMSLIQKVSRTLGDIFLPIIPVLVATGLFMGLRGLLLSFGVHISPELQTLSSILTDTAFIFLPALITWSAAKRFGGNQVIGLVLGLMLVAPQLPNAWAVAGHTAHPLLIMIGALKFNLVGYQGSVLPALILGIFAAKCEAWLHRVVPAVLDLIVTPFITLFCGMILGLFILGPVLHGVETILLHLFIIFLNLPFGIGGLIIGGFQQVFVVFGVHQIFNALEIQLITQTGVDPYNAIISAAIAAQGAAGLAVAWQTKNKVKRALYFSAAIPAFLGITEPVIFGVNLQKIRPFLAGLVGGAAGGACASMLHLGGTGMGITVLPGLMLYAGNHQLIGYISSMIIAMLISFTLTLIFNKPEQDEA